MFRFGVLGQAEPKMSFHKNVRVDTAGKILATCKIPKRPSTNAPNNMQHYKANPEPLNSKP